MTLGFTGHRPLSLPWKYDETREDCIRFKEVLTDTLRKYGVSRVIVGCAEGCDLYAAEIALNLREAGQPLTIECAILFEEQPAKWSEEQQRRGKNTVH
ncbi:hypothetical protein AGMMS49975_20990 [Clostridia bacterium]|nr:hypothetical protein AGMMS49975_20990 [Clostridia bacterium]